MILPAAKTTTPPIQAVERDPVPAHHFTVDVEEYFHVSAMEPHIPVSDWATKESRLRPAMDRIFGLLADHDARGTFFVLGWVAERYPELVREIVAAGHEVASHGMMHRRVTTLSVDEFRDDVRRARAVLQDLTGLPVIGYRAPSFSIVAERLWALDVLVEEGYRYDSSLFPIRRGGYGLAGGHRDPHWLTTPAGDLLEVPPTTLRFAGQNLPAAGGAYFRLFPLSLFQRAFRVAQARGERGTFYIHPWEFDPEQPRVPGIPWTTRVRHYGGLRGTLPRLRVMFREFRFDTIGRTFEAMAAGKRDAR